MVERYEAPTDSGKSEKNPRDKPRGFFTKLPRNFAQHCAGRPPGVMLGEGTHALDALGKRGDRVVGIGFVLDHGHSLKTALFQSADKRG